jgi:hypothetical protein
MRIMTSREWVDLFTANRAVWARFSFDEDPGVTLAEIRPILKSIQAWQLGETSGGRHLRNAARRYAAATGDVDFIAAAEGFIVEEQTHGEALGIFLDKIGAPRIRKYWGDSVFRLFRYALPNIETWTTIVIQIETMALIFYSALRRATPSPLLERICTQMLRDEIPHLHFQFERLGMIHAGRRPILLRATYAAQRLLFLCVVLAVWFENRRMLRAGGFTFADYWRQSWRKMSYYWYKMHRVTEFVARDEEFAKSRSTVRLNREATSRIEGWLH